MHSEKQTTAKEKIYTGADKAKSRGGHKVNIISALGSNNVDPYQCSPDVPHLPAHF